MRKIQESQKRLYSSKFQQYNEDPRSLSWNDKKSQELRFKKIIHLLKYQNQKENFSLHEIGCGLGHFYEFLKTTNYSVTYSGSDIIPSFLEACQKKYPGIKFYQQDISADYELIPDVIKKCDYYCLSGTFHTKEDNQTSDWEKFVFKGLNNMFRMANKGICVNFLTSYSEFYDERLYYADPKVIFDWCDQNLSRFISIEHDIPLYEFTVCIFKEQFIKEQFPGYQKYF